jgi:hypothetical protein
MKAQIMMHIRLLLMKTHHHLRSAKYTVWSLSLILHHPVMMLFELVCCQKNKSIGAEQRRFAELAQQQ